MQSAAVSAPPLPLFRHRTTAAIPATLRRQPPLPNPQRKYSAASSSSNQSKGESNLTGSAVLQALQKAVSEKEKKIMMKKKKKKQQKQWIERGGGNEGVKKEDDDFDYGNVRPINVRSHWEGRIAELETRVQELQSQYHHY